MSLSFNIYDSRNLFGLLAQFVGRINEDVSTIVEIYLAY